MYNNYMFRPCNRAIVRLFNREHQIDYIIGVIIIMCNNMLRIMYNNIMKTM